MSVATTMAPVAKSSGKNRSVLPSASVVPPEHPPDRGLLPSHPQTIPTMDPAGRGNPLLTLQRKIEVGSSMDPLEREADQAAQVALGEHHPIQIRRQLPPLCEAPPLVHQVLRLPGQSLDGETRRWAEPAFGQNFGHVRIHRGEQAEASAQSIQAKAYTVGSQIVLGPGASSGPQYKLLMAHELAHVVQQQGVTPFVQREEDANPVSSLDDLKKRYESTISRNRKPGDTSGVVQQLADAFLRGFLLEMNGHTGESFDVMIQKFDEFLKSPQQLLEAPLQYLLGAVEGFFSPVTEIFGAARGMLEFLVRLQVGLMISQPLPGMPSPLVEAVSALLPRMLAINAKFHIAVGQLISHPADTLSKLGIILTVASPESLAVAENGGRKLAADILAKARASIPEQARVIGHAVGVTAVNAALLALTEGVGNAIVKVAARLGKVASAWSGGGKAVNGFRKIVLLLSELIKELGGSIAKLEALLGKVVGALIKPFEPVLNDFCDFLRELQGFIKKLFVVAQSREEQELVVASKLLEGLAPTSMAAEKSLSRTSKMAEVPAISSARPKPPKIGPAAGRGGSARPKPVDELSSSSSGKASMATSTPGSASQVGKSMATVYEEPKPPLLGDLESMVELPKTPPGPGPMNKNGPKASEDKSRAAAWAPEDEPWGPMGADGIYDRPNLLSENGVAIVGIKDEFEAWAVFVEEVKKDRTRELGLRYNPFRNEYIILQGGPRSVSLSDASLELQRLSAVLERLSHSHPAGSSPFKRLPSYSDIKGMLKNGLIRGKKNKESTFLWSDTEASPIHVTTYGYRSGDPKPYYIKYTKLTGEKGQITFAEKEVESNEAYLQMIKAVVKQDIIAFQKRKISIPPRVETKIPVLSEDPKAPVPGPGPGEEHGLPQTPRQHEVESELQPVPNSPDLRHSLEDRLKIIEEIGPAIWTRLDQIIRQGGPIPDTKHGSKVIAAAIIDVEGYSGPTVMRAINGLDSDRLGQGASIFHATSPTNRTLSVTQGAKTAKGGRSPSILGPRRESINSHANDAEIKLFEGIIKNLPKDAKGTIHFTTVQVRQVNGQIVIEPYPACSGCVRASFETAGQPGIDLVSHAPVYPSGTTEFAESHVGTGK